MITEVRNASFGYDKNHMQLRGLSFVSQNNDITAILGPNGAGKSTFVKCMLGIIPWTSGDTYIDGISIKSIGRNLWKKTGYVPQTGRRMGYTALEMTVLGRSALKGDFAVPDREDYNKAREALREVGISQLENRSCMKMSQGEYQLVMIARAISSQPQLLVLDEPESGLDISNNDRLMNILYRLSREKGMQIIFNTHNPGNALRYADNAMLIAKSRGIWGRAADVLTQDRLEEAYGLALGIYNVDGMKIVLPVQGSRAGGKNA